VRAEGLAQPGERLAQAGRAAVGRALAPEPILKQAARAAQIRGRAQKREDRLRLDMPRRQVGPVRRGEGQAADQPQREPVVLRAVPEAQGLHAVPQMRKKSSSLLLIRS